MATSTIKFVGDSYFSGTHVAGNDIYWRSTSATDAGTITTAGIKTTGTALDRTATALTASEGKVEVLTGQNWDSFNLISCSAARVGTMTFYTDNGTAATATIHVHDYTQIADGNTITFGPVGFETVATFKTTVAGDDQIKIQASDTAQADAIASFILDVAQGSAVDGTDWQRAGTSPAGADAYVSASVASTDVTLMDKISCARQLGWTLSTTVTGGGLSLSSFNGGIDGTELGAIAIGNSSISASASSGINLDSTTTDTLPPGFTGNSKAVQTRGKFSVDVRRTTDPAAAVNAKIQLSPDNVTWNDAPTTTLTDLDGSAGELVTGLDLFSEYMRYVITTHSGTAPIELKVSVTSQS